MLADKEKFQVLIKDTDKRVDTWLEVAERGFNFAEKASEIFADAISEDNIKDERGKRYLPRLVRHRTKDKKLFVSWDNLLFPMQELSKEVGKIKTGLEPAKSVGNKRDFNDLYSQNPRVLRDRDSDPNTQDQNLVSYH